MRFIKKIFFRELVFCAIVTLTVVMIKVKKVIFYWLPPIAWMGLIFFLSSFHQLQVTEDHWQNLITRKAAHFLEYAVLSVLFYRAVRRTTMVSKTKALFLSFFLTIFYAATDEYHQTFVNGRTGKFSDIGIDAIGVFSGTFFCWQVKKFLGLEDCAS